MPKPLLLEMQVHVNQFGPGATVPTSTAFRKFFYEANQRTMKLATLGSDEGQITFTNYSRKIILEQHVSIYWPCPPPSLDWTMIDQELAYEFVNQAIGSYPRETRIPFGQVRLTIPNCPGNISVSPCDSCEN